jgi:trehalose 6-phosphate synthase
VFRTIPAHAELARAMCAYDLLGFQTEFDRTAFVDYVLRYAGGVAAEEGAIRIADHMLRTGVYPTLFSGSGVLGDRETGGFEEPLME